MNQSFSINDPRINKYFLGDNTDPPVRELMYLFSHPLIRPNFINEIDCMVQSKYAMALSAKEKGIGFNSTQIEEACINLGNSLEGLSPKDPLKTLQALREVYNICKT